MGPWKRMGEDNVQPESLCIVYNPPGNYVFATGKDLEQTRKDYPTSTHYSVVLEAPEA